MLQYLGITDFSPRPDAADVDAGRTYLDPDGGLLDDIAGIITAALQEIFQDGPASLSEIPFGRNLYAPATITLNVVQGLAATVVVSGMQDWMNGCSVQIAGDGFVNELANRTGLLRRPYLGPTATAVQATVYGNSIELEQDVRAVLEPVTAGLDGELMPCGDRAAFDRFGGCRLHSQFVEIGRPCAYIVEHQYDETLDYLPTFLRVTPAPCEAQPVTFRAKIYPPTITVEDLGDQDDDPGAAFPIPGRWVESILLPYCLQRFTGSALFKNAEAKAEIARQYAAAKATLANTRPQVSRANGSYANTGLLHGRRSF